VTGGGTRGGALAWRVLRDGALPGALNMARDEALARHVSDAVEAGGTEVLPAFLRFYAWQRPTLSFGRNEPARARFDADQLVRAGVEVVRRPTGGRAVLHHREVTYALVVPARALGGPRDTYRRVNEVLATGLRALGAEVELAPEAPAAALDAGPCFDLPATGEVIALGRKLVGSAQARLGGALLQHGSILLHDDQGRIEELARADAEGPGPGVPPVALAELLPDPPAFGQVVGALEAAAQEAFSPPAADWRASEDGAIFAPSAAFEAERRAHHTDLAWIWRR